jgi:hypothetical protein
LGRFEGGGGGRGGGFHGVQLRGTAVLAVFAVFVVLVVLVVFAAAACTMVLCTDRQFQLLFGDGEKFFQPNYVLFLFFFRRSKHVHGSFLFT